MRLLLATAVTATVLTAGYFVAQQDGPGSEAFCEQLSVVVDVDAVLATLDPLSISAAATQLRALHEVAPPSVRDDVGALLAMTDDLVAEVELPAGNEERAAGAVARRTDLDRIAEAGTAVQAYARDTCGIDLSPAPPPPTIAPPPTPSTERDGGSD